MHMSAATMRVARPTDHLAEITRMYTNGLGLSTLAAFSDHDGFDGVVLGHEGQPYHIEFTSQRGHEVGMAPTQDHLLVFYLPDLEEWENRCARMIEAGFRRVPSYNPYWEVRGRTFEDVDGYRVVLENAAWSHPPEYEIAPARLYDLPSLAGIELAAARLLVGHAPESVLRETTTHGELLEAQRDGLLWVALADNAPVGFAHVKLLEAGVAHLDELDVHPDHGRRGLGTKLVMTVCAWAATSAIQSVTLATFRDVPWNMPFYARLGFEVISSDALSPALRAVVDDEVRRGLDPARRVVMRRDMPREGIRRFSGG